MIVPQSQLGGLELPKVVSVVARPNLRCFRFEASRAQAVLGELAQSAALVHGVTCTVQGGLCVLVDPTEAAAFIERNAAAGDGQTYAAVSVIGYQLQNNTTIAARVAALLEGAGIGLAGLTIHPQSITVWFSETPAENRSARAVQILHEQLCN